MSNQEYRTAKRLRIFKNRINFVLGHSSVTCFTLFAFTTLFSCQQDRLGKPPHTNPTQHAEPLLQKTDSSRSPTQPFAITALQPEVPAFRQAPLALPLQITLKPDNDLQVGNPTAYPTQIEVTTSAGKRVLGKVRWLSMTTRKTRLKTPADSPAEAIAEIPEEPPESQPPPRNPQRPAFRWTERLRPVIAGAEIGRNRDRDGDGGSGGGSGGIAEVEPPALNDSLIWHQAYLVLNNGGDLADGLARIGDSTFTVHLVDQPTDETVDFARLNLEPGDPDRWAHPDPQSVLEAFRRSLLPLPNPQIGSLPAAEKSLIDILTVQRHQRFQLGLARLREVSPSVADTLVELLTRRCRDGRLKIASWPANSNDLRELDRLLAITPSPNQERPWASNILDWCENRPHLFAWVESANGTRIRLAVANLTGVEQELELRWESDSAGLARRTLKIPAELIVRTNLTRPTDQPLRRLGGHGGILLRQKGQTIQRLTVQPRELAVIPPHVVIGPTTEMWQVDSWAGTTPQTTRPAEQTTGLLRYFDHAWQMLFECQVDPILPLPAPESSPDQSRILLPEWVKRAQNQLSPPLEIEQLAGIEAVTFFVGPYAHPTTVFSILLNGDVLLWEGDPQGINPIDLSLKMHYSDASWTFTLNLPHHWRTDAPRRAPVRGQAGNLKNDQVLELGFLRTHHGSSRADCFPYPVLPWRINPGRVRYDLKAWAPVGFDP